MSRFLWGPDFLDPQATVVRRLRSTSTGVSLNAPLSEVPGVGGVVTTSSQGAGEVGRGARPILTRARGGLG